MSYLILAAFLLAAALIGGRALLDADPHKLAQGLRIGGGLVLGVAGLFLSIRGMFFVGAPVALFGLGMVARGLGWNGLPGGFSMGGKRQPSSGGASRVRSAHLEMSLDHDSGDVDGRILKGDHAGQKLSDLDLPTLTGLWQSWQHSDPDAARLLESYLDRVHGADWREDGARRQQDAGTGSRRASSGGGMTRSEALSILELPADASDEDVRQAHRRLMKKAHPDQGGATWYAAKLNEAKEHLLGK